MPIVFFLVAALALGIITGNWVNLAEVGLNSKLPIESQLLIWLLWCVFYGLGEEGGWRGFLFPEFDKWNTNSRMATLFTAIIWAPWHLPVFFYDKDLGSMGFLGTVGWIVGLVFGSFLLGWLLKQSRHSLWPVILWHGTFNFFTTSDRINPLFAGLMSAKVIVFVLWLARRYREDLVKFQPG